MAFPDVLTIVAIASGSNLLVGGFMVLMHRSKPNSGYFHLLAAGALAAAFGWGLYATRLLDWPTWASFVLANALITLYPALLALALRRHLGRRLRPAPRCCEARRYPVWSTHTATRSSAPSRAWPSGADRPATASGPGGK